MSIRQKYHIRYQARLWAGLFLFVAMVSSAAAHGVHGHDQAFITSADGAHPFPFIYLGAKHMVTGYDHLAYLAGVIFFLSKVKDVFKFVSLFAIGHSITLLTGILAGIDVNPYFICLLYTSPSPRDRQKSRMPSSA